MKPSVPELLRDALVRGEDARSQDGRDIDPRLGTLTGEGAAVHVIDPARAWPLARQAPDVGDPHEGEGRSYYGLSALKVPAWKAWIPAYFYLGGLAGGSSTLGAAVQLVGGQSTRSLALRARWVSAIAISGGAVFLIADLGRPARFLYMLRVFRPTSPMNVGTWIVSAAGATMAGAAVLQHSRGRRGRVAADVFGLAAGALGLPLAGYTAVLIANTAVPVWAYGRRSLPFLFVGSAIASAASALELAPASPPEERVVRMFGVIGKVTELAAGIAFERELPGDAVRRALHLGPAGVLFQASRALTVISLGLGFLGRTSPIARLGSAVVGSFAAVAVRFAVTEAGRASARDPHATFVPQRASVVV